MSDDINAVVFDTAEEPTVVDLSEFAEEPGGAWAAGWYKAEILEGYSTNGGKVFTTSDEPSKDGNSRNLRICFRIHKGEDTRNIQEGYNYRVTDFTPERLAHIKEARMEYKDIKGRWPDGDAQRSSLAVAKLGALGKATTVGVPLAQGHVNPALYIGKSVDVRLVVGDNGYNEVKQVLPSGSRAK